MTTVKWLFSFVFTQKTNAVGVTFLQKWHGKLPFLKGKRGGQIKVHLQPSELAKMVPDDLNLQQVWFMSILYKHF